MSWTGRLFGAWILFSLVWATTLGAYGIYRWSSNPWRPVAQRAVPEQCDQLQPPPWCSAWRTHTADSSFERYKLGAPTLWDVAGIALGPPIALLLVGGGTWWMLRGLRKESGADAAQS